MDGELNHEMPIMRRKPLFESMFTLENVQMKKSKLFDGAKFVPAHVGVYEVNNGTGIPSYQYWNGKFWAVRTSSINSAYSSQIWKSCFHSPTWRGIKK